MAASLKRLEDEIADDENTSEENGPESEATEDPHSSTASASNTKSDDEEKKTPVPKKKSTSKKSKKNAELPEDAYASDASALPTSSNVGENSTSGTKLKSILKKTRKSGDKSTSEYNECPVCLGPAVFPVRTPCGHVFCFLCVKGAARQANRCPMCRQHIPIDFDKNPIILERQEVETFEDGYQWFYEGKNGWWQYEKRTSDEIEQHYKLNVLKFDVLICGTMYTIDLDRSVQYNRDNPYRRRKVKRENANNIAVKGVAGVH
ncbi:E3 ubiquitin-protein ligase rnf146 [Acyrthosiphon pisum]|uniref:E3 ubiquitin-protein ligase n=1 Tax=Acyrthosiphon pisum TaxID=7029 RepID=A0A8R1VZ84_ACYPI|nr:E3 ubiquitin-protein ligase rnf146 [Acyrthosiphon pisum]|eukprot:XP_001944628.1 PREDICTED: E3 ubiquitin-protein ligase rnf146-like [Acyrthosiphon pisum]